MPFWGWLCVGVFVLAILACGAFYLFAVLPFNRKKKRLDENGRTVVGKIFLANPSLYTTEPALLEGAFVVFTMSDDVSEQHLAKLQAIIDRLDDFEPDEDDPDEKKIAWSLETQRTVGRVIPLPSRVTGGMKAYFATPVVYRRMLPEGKLTEEYLYLRVLIDDDISEAEMTEYPDPPRPKARRVRE